MTKFNKFDIYEYLHQSLSSHASSFKETSFDSSNNEYLCSDSTTSPVYSFDDYVRKEFDLLKTPASPDAIYIGKKNLYFIEFKNQLPAKINKESLKNKFIQGTKILQEMLKDFAPQDVDFIFCIVHKDERSNYFEKSHIESMAQRFGLEAENSELDNFYSKIIGDNITFFKELFTELQCEEPI